MRERLLRRGARGRVDGQAAGDEVFGGGGDAAPEGGGLEAVVGYEDGLHFFEVGVAVEGCVAT